MRRALRCCAAAGLFAAWALVAVPSAQATLPGTNGKIAFQSGNAIATVNPDGTGFASLGGGPCQNTDPAWSPDGAKIAYAREASGCTGNFDIAVMNADGTNQQVVSGADTTLLELYPTWSFDQTKIGYFREGFINSIPAGGGTPVQLSNPNTGAGQFDEEPDWWANFFGTDLILFQRTNSALSGDIWLMSGDGSGEAAASLANTAADERAPSFHPSGSQYAFRRDNDIWVRNTGLNTLTNVTNSAGAERQPAWSPDGTRIAFDSSAGIETMNANGSGRVTVNPSGQKPSWQRLTGYVRPQAATNTRLGLVPAYKECPGANPNGVDETEPFTSCVPPLQSSDYLTVGTQEANGAAAKSVGFVKFKSLPGNTSTTTDEADLNISARITDVRLKSDLSDYTGQLMLLFELKKTTRQNRLNGTSSYTLGGTTGTHNVTVMLPCTATPADATVGSTCSVTTSADAIGAEVVEGKRTIWQVPFLIVRDGGSDGNPLTGVNTDFAETGNFIP